jgi:hypothetical protein
MRLARPLTGTDGAVVAGVGTGLTPSLVRMLLTMDVESVWVEDDVSIADWEKDKDLDDALADLANRFAHEAPDPVRDALEAALREHLQATAPGREADTA